MQVTLLKPHTHAGVDHPAGAELDVPESDAAWLAEQDIVADSAFDAVPIALARDADTHDA